MFGGGFGGFFADIPNIIKSNTHKQSLYARYLVLIYDDDAHLLQDDGGVQLYGI